MQSAFEISYVTAKLTDFFSYFEFEVLAMKSAFEIWAYSNLLLDMNAQKPLIS